MIYSTTRSRLKRGSRHPDVLELQQILSQQLRPIPLSGQFDYETEIAVKHFQSCMFLKPDGIVDSLTWQALYTNTPVGMPTLRQGCHGTAVTAVQELLSIDYYYPGKIDGRFGLKTHRAVQCFQSDYALEANGIVDEPTWRALSQV